MINLEFNTLSELQRLRKSDIGLRATTLNQVSILEVGVFSPVKRFLENTYLDIGKAKDNWKSFNFPLGVLRNYLYSQEIISNLAISAEKLRKLKLFALLRAGDDFQ